MSLNNSKVCRCSESTSNTPCAILISEALALHNHICDSRCGPTRWVNLLHAIWKEECRVAYDSPRIPVESKLRRKVLALIYQLHILDHALHVLRGDVDRLADCVTDLASSVNEVIVISEATSVEVYDANSQTWTLLGVNVIYDWLGVVLEASKEIVPVLAIG